MKTSEMKTSESMAWVCLISTFRVAQSAFIYSSTGNECNIGRYFSH